MLPHALLTANAMLLCQHNHHGRRYQRELPEWSDQTYAYVHIQSQPSCLSNELQRCTYAWHYLIF